MIHFQTSEMMCYHAEGLRIPPSIPSDRAFFPLDCPTFVFYYQCWSQSRSFLCLLGVASWEIYFSHKTEYNTIKNSSPWPDKSYLEPSCLSCSPWCCRSWRRWTRRSSRDTGPCRPGRKGRRGWKKRNVSKSERERERERKREREREC